MTNCEFYKDEIRKIGIHSIAVDKETGKLCACNIILCKNCLLAKDNPEKLCCEDNMLNWLLREHEEENHDES